MKRLFSIILTLVYFFTASSLVHASTMGFFDMSHSSQQTASHCHPDLSSKAKPSQQNMSCCALFSSSQYSQVKLDFKTSIKSFQSNEVRFVPSINLSSHFLSAPQIAFSPGGQTSLGKYNKFSDLFGVIVKII